MPTLVNQLLTQLWSLTPAFFWLTKNVELIHSLALLGQQSSTRVSKWERFEELNKKVFLWELQGTYFDDYVPRSSQSGFFKTANWVGKSKDFRVFSEANAIFKVAEEL